MPITQQRLTANQPIKKIKLNLKHSNQKKEKQIIDQKQIARWFM